VILATRLSRSSITRRTWTTTGSSRCAAAMGNDDLEDMPPRRAPLDDAVEQFRWFVRDDALAGAPTLAGILHHLDTAWRRRHDPNIVLCHFADFPRDPVPHLLRLPPPPPPHLPPHP